MASQSDTKRKIQQSPKGYVFIRKLEGITEYRLESNGLRVLLIPDNSVPVAGCMVTYHVGSRNEATGFTGATHMLEHLMFKGSKNFNKESNTTVWDLLEPKGALVNATTWFDRTNYYEVVPKDLLDIAIRLEADRMRTARIQESDRQSEMTVVRNEFERGENDPAEALDKQIWALAFQAHPYHHSTIGWRSDIEKVPIERLQQFYNDFYWPNNATVTISGDFDESSVLSLIKEEFGAHPKAPHDFPSMYTEEPAQEGERRAVVSRSGANMVGIAHKIPRGTHEDIPALILLDAILSDGKTSRLYKALVDPAYAMDISIYTYQLFDPGLFITYTTLTPGTPHTKAEERIKKVYREVGDKGVTAGELARAKRAIRMAFGERRDGVYALLSSLNEDLATGDWTRFATLPAQIEAVTAREVKMIAKKYLRDETSTVGWFISNNA